MILSVEKLLFSFCFGYFPSHCQRGGLGASRPPPTPLLLFAGRLVASLVAEFLQFFNLDFTLAVFQPETSTVRMMPFPSLFETVFDADESIVSGTVTKFDNLECLS